MAERTEMVRSSAVGQANMHRWNLVRFVLSECTTSCSISVSSADSDL